MFVWLIAASAADVGTTGVGLSLGHVEASPGVRLLLGVFGLFGLVLAKWGTFAVVAALKTWRSGAGSLVGWSCVGLMGGVSAWNCVVLAR